MSAVETAANQRAAPRRSRRSGVGLRLGRRRHRQDDACSSSASCRAVCERGARRRLDPRHHLHASAPPASCARGSARALRERGRHDLARELDGAWISTIHGFCLRLLKRAPVRGRARPALPRARRAARARVLRGEAFDAALDRVLRDGEPERLRLLATYGAAAAAADAHGRLRDAALGRPAARRSSSASAPTCPTRLEELARGRALPRRRRGRDRHQRAARGAAARLLDATRAPGAAARPPATCALRGERAATYEEARKARRAGGARERWRSRDRDLLQELLERFAAAYAAAKERESALDFEDLQLRARDLLRDHERDPRARAAALPLDHGRRVPGHEPRCSASSSTCSRASRRGALLRRRRVPVDLRLPARRRRASSASGARQAASVLRADAELPLAAGGARRRQPPLRAPTFGDEFQPLPPSGDFPDPVFGHPVELLVTDKASYADTGDALAARRGAARRAPRARARRRGRGRRRARSSSSSRPAPTPSGTRRSCARSGLPTYRATGRGYFGQQQVVDLLALPAAAAQPLRRRGARHRARLAVRRRLERRARAAAPRSAAAAALHRARAGAAGRRSAERDERLLRAFRQRYDRLAAVAGAARARAALRADRRRARLRPRRARPVGRPPPLREPAQARAARALVRGAARPRRRGLRPLRPRAGGRRRDGARGGRRGGGRRRGAAADDPRGQGARVQGRHRRRRRPRRGRRRAADEILALSDGRFGFKVVDPATGRAARRVRLRRGAEARASGRARPSGCASTTSR